MCEDQRRKILISNLYLIAQIRIKIIILFYFLLLVYNQVALCTGRSRAYEEIHFNAHIAVLYSLDASQWYSTAYRCKTRLYS